MSGWCPQQNKDLEREVEKNTFREDLFYRLNSIIVHLPPLRERKEDIPLLVDHFLDRMIGRGGSTKISPEILSKLIDYSWPGNVRELANVLQRACLLTGEGKEIQAHSLSLRVVAGIEKSGASNLLLFHAKKEHIERVLVTTKGNKARAARALGITRKTLYRKLAEG